MWTILAGTVVGALSIAYRARKYPYADDWSFLPFVTGQEPVTLTWLWAQHSSHRLPLLKLLFLGLYSPFVTYDGRLGILFGIVCLAALAAVLILATRQVRGHTLYSDAFFPFTLLHWGLGALWWDFQLQFVCSTVLAGILLSIILRYEGRLTLGGALSGVGCLLLLPMCGSNGVVLVPALAVWFVLVGLHGVRSGDAADRRPSWLAVVAGTLSVAVCLAYLATYRDSGEYAGKDVGASLLAGARFLSSGLGSAFSFFAIVPWRLLVPSAALLGLASLVLVALKQPSERLRATGMGLFLLSFGCLAAAIGVGRGDREWGGDVDTHYAVLALPILWWSYAVWTLHLPSRPIARFCQMSLLIVMCMVFALNLRGVGYATNLRVSAAAFEADVYAGTPASVLVDRHGSLFWWQDNVEGKRWFDTAEGKRIAVGGLLMLRERGALPFKLIRDQ